MGVVLVEDEMDVVPVAPRQCATADGVSYRRTMAHRGLEPLEHHGMDPMMRQRNSAEEPLAQQRGPETMSEGDDRPRRTMGARATGLNLPLLSKSKMLPSPGVHKEAAADVPMQGSVRFDRCVALAKEHGLSLAEVGSFANEFSKMDANGDGTLSND